MFPERFGSLSGLCGSVGAVRRLCAARGGSWSRRAAARPPPRDRVSVPGLEPLSYGPRMHFVPGLARPDYPRWERDYPDPRFYRPTGDPQGPLQHLQPGHVFHQRSSLLEGVRQVAWLTKATVTPSLPPQLLSLAEDPDNQLDQQDQRVQNAIRHARFWDETGERPPKERYGTTLLLNLLHLCASLRSKHPALGRRILAEDYSLTARWTRGEDLFEVRGRSSLLHCSADPVPQVSGAEEVSETAGVALETFYPINPTIDLQRVHLPQQGGSCTGFRDQYPYPHAHTLYFLEAADPRCKLQPDQFRAKMAMFSFGNALARAHRLYGTQPRVLDRPITVQAVGTNGRIFQFLLFQLNTTDLDSDHGVKNQMWLQEDVEMYDFAKVRPAIKKKQVKVPAGLAGFRSEAFSRFLALYLHGAVQTRQA